MNVQERLRFTADFIDAACRESGSTKFIAEIYKEDKKSFSVYQLQVKDCPRAHNLYGSDNDNCWILQIAPNAEWFKCYTICTTREKAIKLFIENDLTLQYSKICDAKIKEKFSDFKNGTEAGEYAAAKINAVFNIMDIVEKLSVKAKKLTKTEFEKVPFIE